MKKSIHKGMMTEDILSVENGKVAKKKSCHSIGSCLYGFFKRFAVSGERRVWRQQMTKEDFELPEDFKIAKYDADLVAKFWNNRNRRRSILKVIGKLFVEGIISKLVPIVFLYLVLYYTLNPFYFNATLCKTTNQNVINVSQKGDPDLGNFKKLPKTGEHMNIDIEIEKALKILAERDDVNYKDKTKHTKIINNVMRQLPEYSNLWISVSILLSINFLTSYFVLITFTYFSSIMQNKNIIFFYEGYMETSEFAR